MGASVVLFDDGLGELSPLTDLRAAFDVRTGAFTLRERLWRDAGSGLTLAAWECPEPLRALVRERMGGGAPWIGEMRGSEDVLFINGRCPLVPVEAMALGAGTALVEAESGHIIAARAGLKRAASVVRSDATGLGVVKHSERVLLARPWDVIRFRDRCLAHDLGLLMRVGGGGAFAFRVDASAKVHPSTIFDVERGHVHIAEGATIRPGAIIVGPASIGPHSTVLERTLIKPGTAIGPWCKVAGEIAGTIFQGYANKAHDGHLGDSWVGEWANLGAGTTNSNLLNTYGEVIARPLGAGGKPGSNERTGLQFLGAMIGDHVKTAICTRIMTGAVVGTGTMFAATGPLSGTVPPLSWITDAGMRAFTMEKFLDVAKTVMERRSLSPSQSYEAALRALSGGLAG